MALNKDESSLVVVGGMTSACVWDALAHSFDLLGNGGWEQATPSSLIRRRGASMISVDNGSPEGELMLIGGVADAFSCCESDSTK